MASTGHPSSTGRRPAPMRLTRRGRFLLLLLLPAVAALVLSIGRGAASQAATRGGANPPATRIVVVQPGESLWTVAERIAPAADPRETIGRIVELNNLTSSVVPAGHALVVPAPAA